MKRLCIALIAILLVGCSFQNRYEKQADRVTHAIMNNSLSQLQDDVEKGVKVSRVQVAQWSDELNDQGKLISIKETTANCDPGWHCFNVKFDKHDYVEQMRLDENGKVVQWRYHMASPGGAQ